MFIRMFTLTKMSSKTATLSLGFSFLLLVQKKRNKEKDTFLKVFFGPRPKIAFDFLKLVQGFPIS